MRRPRIAGRFVGAILPVLAAAAVGASMFAGDLGMAHVLRVIAPDEVPPGGVLPLRAYVFAEGDDLSAREPFDAEIRAHLEAQDESFRTSPTALGRSLALGSEGEILVPENAPALVTLNVEAHGPSGALVRATRRLRVRADDARPKGPREQGAGASGLELGPIRAEGAEAPPTRLELSVPSGSCVPELPCRLEIVASEGEVAVEAALHVEVVDRASTGATVIVRGPEGNVTLVASRDGEVVARRDVRLPLSPGGVSVEIGPAFALVRSVEGGPLAIDVFRNERWIRATSQYTRPGEATRIRLDGLDDGRHRVDAYRHPFARRAGDHLGVGQPFEGASITRAAHERSRLRGRIAGALLVLVAGLVASALLVRRGLGAEADARRIMAPGSADPSFHGARFARAEVLGYALLVLVAFGAVAAFVWVGR